MCWEVRAQWRCVACPCCPCRDRTLWQVQLDELGGWQSFHQGEKTCNMVVKQWYDRTAFMGDTDPHILYTYIYIYIHIDTHNCTYMTRVKLILMTPCRLLTCQPRNRGVLFPRPCRIFASSSHGLLVWWVHSGLFRGHRFFSPNGGIKLIGVETTGFSSVESGRFFRQTCGLWPIAYWWNGRFFDFWWFCAPSLLKCIILRVVNLSHEMRHDWAICQLHKMNPAISAHGQDF